MPKLNALVAGSSGYIGIQLIKLLVKHKYINIKYLCGSSSVGKKISNYEEKEILDNEINKLCDCIQTKHVYGHYVSTQFFSYLFLFVLV